MPATPPPSRFHACVYGAITAAVALLGGCVSKPQIEAEPLAAASAADRFTTRSLRDTGLREFLQTNLGQVPITWDFEALCWVAFYYHPSLEVARAQWATAQAAQRTATERPNPTVTLSPGYNFTREAGISPWMPAVSFDFLVSSRSKRNLQATIARNETEASRLAVFNAAWQVRTELRRALTDVALANRREVQLRAQADVQRALLALLEQRFAAGGTTATEVSTARTALLRLESSAADAQGQALTAKARAATALGLPLVTLEGVTLPVPPLATPLPAEVLAAARREALLTRADILIALAKYQAAHAALQLEVAKRFPDFHLGPGYQWDQGSNKWTLGLSFELPLFHHNEAGIAAATARRAEAAAQFTLIQAQTIAAVDLAVSAQVAAQFQLEQARKLRLEAQQQSGRLQQRIDLGAADQVELNTARLDILASETALLEAENSAASAAGQLEDALQMPFPHLAALAAAPNPSASHP